jgi:hypothetical protein
VLTLLLCSMCWHPVAQSVVHLRRVAQQLHTAAHMNTLNQHSNALTLHLLTPTRNPCLQIPLGHEHWAAQHTCSLMRGLYRSLLLTHPICQAHAALVGSLSPPWPGDIWLCNRAPETVSGSAR